MTYEEVYQEIKTCLKTKTPHLTLRIGDGEGIFIKGGSKRNYVCNRQWGFIPSEEEQNKIAEYVKDSYTNADIIGVPTKHHIENCGSYWANAYPWLEEARPIVKNIPKASIDLHSELLTSGLLNTLLSKQDELIYISGRNLDKQFKETFGIEHIDSFIVNAEQKFETRKSQNHWPHQFKMVEEWINRTEIAGKLCLCGAGVLGKYYAHLLKRNGGIVLDLGSVFDNWIGKCTRGKGRGAEATDNKYKL
jgi:hypothetical protein